MKLVIAEEPSVARALAAVLGANQRREGYLEGNGCLVSWCYGHLAALKYPDEYGDKWGKPWTFDQLPMIPETWEFKVSENEVPGKQFEILRTLMESGDVESIVCATDADREGECIFRYVYRLIGSQKPVERLWLSSLEESAIEAAWKKMKPMADYDALFDAGYCRARADWLVGMNASRLFSCRYRGALNIGRVQTPTLAMIVARDSDVEHFVKQKYFTVDLELGEFAISSGRVDSEEEAEALALACAGKTAAIQSVTREKKTENPPKLYDLTMLQRDANKIFGFTAQQTLDCAQSLYERKLATYPRTDSRYLTEDIEESTRAVIDAAGEAFDFGKPENPNVRRCVNNAKVTGHHAILPTAGIRDTDAVDNLPDGERSILSLLASRLLCACAEPHSYEAVKVTAVCAGTEFFASGKTVLNDGWKAFEFKKKEDPGDTEDEEDKKSLPEVREEQEFEVKSAAKTEHYTSPPKPYTEDTLLSAMEHAGQDEYDEESEKKGLGTPATRANTIEGLVSHGYVSRKGKQLISTERGRNLVSVVPEEIKSAKLTADWETRLRDIERSGASAQDFMTGIETSVRDLCVSYGSADDTVSFDKREPLGKCPKCQAPVVKGNYGPYCTGKCGMIIAKVYGHALTEAQIKSLLKGKQISFTANGFKNTVFPEVVSNEYSGKTYYAWKTRGERVKEEKK